MFLACLDEEENVMDNGHPLFELQQAVHEDDEEEIEKLPPTDKETSPRFPTPNNTNKECKQDRSPTPPTIRKMTEGWRKEKKEEGWKTA